VTAPVAAGRAQDPPAAVGVRRRGAAAAAALLRAGAALGLGGDSLRRGRHLRLDPGRARVDPLESGMHRAGPGPARADLRQAFGPGRPCGALLQTHTGRARSA